MCPCDRDETGRQNPKERYQTAFGEESDLRRRVAEWEPDKFIADVSPAHDAADCLLLLERLFGRARDLAIPLIAFGRALAGYSGIGESTSVNESPKPLVPEFPQQQAQRSFHLFGAALGILSRFWFPVLLPFQRRANCRRSAHILGFEQEV